MEVIHNNKYISIKTKSCGDGIKPDFHDGILQEKTPCATYFELFLNHSVYEVQLSSSNIFRGVRMYGLRKNSRKMDKWIFFWYRLWF